jgi:uncharacterized protein YidB (DUF937 family)
MGLLDDVLGSAVPQGSLAKPLLIALGALVASGALHSQSAPSQAAPSQQPESTPGGDGGLLAGLGGLLNRFQQSGQGDVMKSWVGSGQNMPISPSQLGSVLGPGVVGSLAQRTGLSEEEITSQLSQLLPGVVDRLTPNGRLPTQAEATQMR